MNINTLRRVTGRALGLAAAVSLFACNVLGTAGYEATASDQIWADAVASATKANSVHVSGSGTDSNGGALKIDLKVQGSDSDGSVALGPVSVKFISVGGKFYIHGSELVAMMSASNPALSAQLSAVIGTKWVLMPSGNAYGQEDLAAIGKMSEFSSCLKSHGKLATGPVATVNGQSTVEVDDTSTKGAHGQVAIFVRTDAPHNLARVVSPPGTTKGCFSGSSSTDSAGGTLDFVDWGTDFKITAPADTIDFTALGQA